MPDINESTPRGEITIAGESFKVYRPYAEGYTINANEANALNQTFSENVRNNFAKVVTEAKDSGEFDLSVLQNKLDDYMDAYEFGVRTGGGARVTDPVKVEALSIMSDKVREAAKKKHGSLAGISAKAIRDKALELLDQPKHENVWELARKRVAEQRETVSDLDVDAIEGIAPVEEAPAEEGAESEAPKAKGKAKQPVEA